MKYVLYARTSSDTQKKDLTIQTQLEAAQAWAHASGRKFSVRYLDDGVSAKVPFDERPESSRLLRDARLSRFTHVVVYDYKRLGRDQLDTLKAIQELSKVGVRVQSVLEPMPEGAEDDVSAFMIGVLTSFGQYDWANLRRKLSDGRQRAMRDGRYTGYRVALGYRIENKRLVPYEPEAGVVRHIFESYARGNQSLTRVAARLNAEGIPGPAAWRGGESRWDFAKVQKILRRETYAGTLRQRRGAGADKEIVIPVPALVSREMFDRVQALLSDRLTFSDRAAKHDYLLSSLAKCGICGLAFVGSKRTERGGRELWYRCNASWHSRPPCGNGMVRAEEVERDVWTWCAARINNPATAIEDLRLHFARDDLSALDPAVEIAHIESLITAKTQARAKLLRVFVNSADDDEDALRVLSELEAEREALEQEREGLRAAAQQRAEREERIEAARSLLVKLKRKARTSNFATRRDIVRQLIGRIEITKKQRSAAPPRLEITPRA